MKTYKNLFSVLMVAMVAIYISGCGRVSSNSKVEDSATEIEQSDTGEPSRSETAVPVEILEGDIAPDFTAETRDGSTFTLSEQSGKVVLLNFWATWCGPCVNEMPAFEELYNEYGDEVSILAVDCMEEKEIVDRFVEENHYTFPVAYDTTGTVNALYPTNGIPYTLIIDQNGEVSEIHLGAVDANTQYRVYKSAIDALLN